MVKTDQKLTSCALLLTMIDPASSWFEIVELPVVELSPTSSSKIKAKSHDKTKDAYFDKSSSMISTLVNRQADRACGSSSQGQTDHCFFNSWTDRQTQLLVLFCLVSSYVRSYVR